MCKEYAVLDAPDPNSLRSAMNDKARRGFLHKQLTVSPAANKTGMLFVAVMEREIDTVLAQPEAEPEPVPVVENPLAPDLTPTPEPEAPAEEEKPKLQFSDAEKKILDASKWFEGWVEFFKIPFPVIKEVKDEKTGKVVQRINKCNEWYSVLLDREITDVSQLTAADWYAMGRGFSNYEASTNANELRKWMDPKFILNFAKVLDTGAANIYQISSAHWQRMATEAAKLIREASSVEAGDEG